MTTTLVETPTAEVAGLAADLRSAGRAWAARPLAERLEVLAQWRAQIEAARGELVEHLSRDTGRTGLSHLEVDAVLQSIDRMSGWAPHVLAPPEPVPSSDPGVTITAAPVPFGLVGVISPWNFPLQLALIDAVPALIAGAPVVIKPSEITPHFVPVLRRTIEAVPELAGVLGIVEGGPAVGSQVISLVDAVCFTGSVRTGRLVGAAAAERFIPAYLELGGKDAAIVTADADLEVASSGILWGSTANTGQSCMSLERVYVEEAVAKRFIDRLVTKAKQVTLESTDPGVGDIGPFIDPRQADIVAAQLEDAVARGATIRTGGVIEEHAGRRFLRPTVVTGVDHDMALMTEETFGPVIPVMIVPDTEAAIELANATDYGLSGAVFAAPERAASIASQMLAGGISINDACLTAFVPDGEKQAFKSSGLGPTRMGPSSLRRFVRQRVLLTRVQQEIQPWWYHDDSVAAGDA